MKVIAAIYLVLFGVAAVVSVIFPAEDIYVSPVEVRQLETRVERVVSDPVNLSQQIEVNVKEVASLDARITAIEAQGASSRVELVERQAVGAAASAAEAQAKLAREAQRRSGADVFLFILIVAGSIGAVFAARALCRKTGRTSAGTPMKP